MKKLLFIFWCIILPAQVSPADFPEKTITIVVHSKPGSGIDITSRQLALLAPKYIDVPIVIENKAGGSGTIAMRHVLNKKADGYTVLAVTKSFISTVMLSSAQISMDDFHFLACMVIDPEVLITRQDAAVNTFEQLMADAKAKNGQQKWLGPLVGGVDHLMAVKIWDKTGISGEWIPYEGGSDALAALMGGHGLVYVGNPLDVKGRPALKIAAIATKERLSQFPETPTFAEFGYDIQDDVLWRGFALKKDTNPAAIGILENLFSQLSQDSVWIKFVESSSAQPVFLENEAFSEMVQNDQQEAKKYLQIAGILTDTTGSDSGANPIIFGGILIIGAALGFIFYKRGRLSGDTAIGLLLICLSIYLYFVTQSFPVGKLSKTAGPASMPRLLIFSMLIFALWLVIQSIRRVPSLESKPIPANFTKVLLLLALMTGYLLIINYFGYFISTFLFLLIGIYLMGYRKHGIIICTVAGFLLIAYFAFLKVLQVPLPRGAFWGF